MVGNMKAFLVILLAFSLIPFCAGYKLPASQVYVELSMVNHKITDLAAPSEDTDAVTKAYADSVAIGSGLPTTGGTMTGQIDFGGYVGFNSTSPINDTDLSTKKYVDDSVSPLAIIEPSQLNYSLPFSSTMFAEGSNITLDSGFLFGASNDYYVTPEHFGAVGDNIANDTAALQAAIDFAYLDNVAVQLGPKIYNFTGLQLYPGSIIRGISGDDIWQTSGYASALRYSGSGVAFNLTNSTGEYNYKFRLSDFAILGPGYASPSMRAGTGIYACNVSECRRLVGD